MALNGPGKKKEGHLVAILKAYHKLNAVLLSRVPGLQAAARSGVTRPRGEKRIIWLNITYYSFFMAQFFLNSDNMNVVCID